MKQATLEAGDLSVVVDADGGDFGWCGLSQISHRQFSKNWLLSPAFTLEHYIGVPFDAKEYTEYEPCYSGKRLEAVTPNSCILRYAPSRCSEIDFRAEYRLKPPHFIDVTMTAKTERTNWPHRHFAMFFATIVNMPIYTGINMIAQDILVGMKGQNHWLHFNGMAVQQGKTAHPAGVTKPELPRASNAPTTYYFSDSSVRFDEPMFYAQVENMVFAVMFKRGDRERVRFTVNPVAPAFGGPAWDFVWTEAEPLAGQSYELAFRSVFKPFAGREDILTEYEAFARQ